jgi:hypothetical protein
MGVKLGAGGYPTQEAAERAGQQSLTAFLEELAREARRKLKAASVGGLFHLECHLL